MSMLLHKQQLATGYTGLNFNTTLYTGNGDTTSGLSVNTGTNLVANSGVVWIKCRNAAQPGSIFATKYTNMKYLYPHAQSPAALDEGSFSDLVTWNTNGVTLKGNYVNTLNNTYVIWTFMDRAKFFEHKVVNHTAGQATTVALGTLGAIGCVVIKALDTTSNWCTWFRDMASNVNVFLNGNAAPATSGALVNVSGTTVTITSSAPTSQYLVMGWAHDETSTGLSAAGAFVNSNNTQKTFNWQPEFMLIRGDGGYLYDEWRGIVGPNDRALKTNGTTAEATYSNFFEPNSSGFLVQTAVPYGFQPYHLSLRRDPAFVT